MNVHENPNHTPVSGTYIAWDAGRGITKLRFFRDGLKGSLGLASLDFTLNQQHVPHLIRRAA